MGKEKLFSKTGKKTLNPMEAFRKKEREKEKKKKKGHFPKDDHTKDPKAAPHRPEAPKKHNQSTILQNNVTLRFADLQNEGEVVHSKKESVGSEQEPVILTKRKDEQYINYFENNPEAMQDLIEEKHRLRDGKKAGPAPLQNVLKTINKQESHHEPRGKQNPKLDDANANKNSLMGNLPLQAQQQAQQQAEAPKKEEKKIGYKFSYKSPFDADPFDPIAMLQKNQLPKPPAVKAASKQKIKDNADPFFKATLDESYNPVQKKVHKPEPEPENKTPQPPTNLAPQTNPGTTITPSPISQPLIQQPPMISLPTFPVNQLPYGGNAGGGFPTPKPISSSAVIVREASVIKTPQSSMQAERVSLVPMQLQKKKQANPTNAHTSAPSNPMLSSFFSEINKLG